jgi:O-antigen biosynthesis protein
MILKKLIRRLLRSLFRRLEIDPGFEHYLADHPHWPKPVETSAPVFYIKAPGYTPLSGGIIACHILCRELNRLGYEAYISAPAVSGTLRTPMLTSQIVYAHKKVGRRPIAIYPEVYTGNDLNCDRVIRYLLNRPGVFSFANPDATNAFWQSPARKSEFHIHFAEEFKVPYLNSVPLYTPIVDEGIFFEEVGAEREGFLVYSKRRDVHDAMVPDWARPYTLVSMAAPRSPQELAHLYRRSRGLIVFERTGARMEAAMCGCPVVAIPSESFPQLPLFYLFGNLGLGWGADVDKLHWAQQTLGLLQRAYRAHARAYPARLAEVVEAALRFFADP